MFATVNAPSNRVPEFLNVCNRRIRTGLLVDDRLNPSHRARAVARKNACPQKEIYSVFNRVFRVRE
jgi:hypothetical protein